MPPPADRAAADLSIALDLERLGDHDVLRADDAGMIDDDDVDR